jgi:quinol-cytochrome oxidoreductase complex cytochrome b subunit
MTHPSSPATIKHAFPFMILIGLFFVGLALTLLSLSVSQVYASGAEPPTPEPTSVRLSPRLDKPIIPTNPTMADKGALPYWGICLTCHGDKGQGLTDEWRQVGFGADMNCWKSKCHAPNHPNPGFTFPHLVPAIIGPGTLQRFTTAQELKDYLKTSMPWWDPGSLSEQDSWDLTAYLLRENGVLSPSSNIDPRDASILPVHLPIRPRENEYFGQYILSALLGLAAITFLGKTFYDRQILSSGGTGGTRPGFFHHLHPPTIPLPQARWRYTLGAGGLAVFLTIIVAITGVLEMFFYIPTLVQAGPSVQLITFMVPFGGLVRGLHFWGAQALVLVAGLHLLRVIFTGAYQTPRRFNFLLGLGLFVLVIFLDFTGYILRWDNGIHWALIVGTNMLKTIPAIGENVYTFVVGGQTPGPATLVRFYAWHVFGLTLLAIVLVVWHIFRIRRDGGISAPDPENRTELRRISRFELVRREILAMLIAGTGLILIATLFSPPIAAPIQDANMPLNPDVRAPWFFLWVQQLLHYGNAFWMGIALPIGILIILGSIPYVFPKIPSEQKGRWFPRAGRIVQITTAVIALAWLILTILELLQGNV